ncbi:MAG: glycosyltransferase [Oscillospiraceae bacterium]|nr:glycosyltransferase [Oscillospiraceae bacterium]
MVLQQLLFPEKDIGCPSMYIRGGKINGSILSIGKQEALSFDTYFNSFSYTKYRDHTIVDTVEFTLNFSGSITLSLCVYNGEEHTICKTSSSDGTVALQVQLSALPADGFLYPVITADAPTEIYSGTYSANCTPHDINVCAAICTFRREEYVLDNIKKLKAYNFSYINRVFVIDNGRTLDKEKLSDGIVQIIPNKNYGGSGGFTRGLIEGFDGGYSHIILMDDDIRFHPQTLERMTVFMSLLTERDKDSWFSAAMLPISQEAPYIQYEMGASWTGRLIKNSKNGADVRKRSVLLDNLNNPDIQYGAWWCLCMPLTIVEHNGLPYPFFIKFDDVEYGLRKPDGTKVITANGIAVYHEAFDKKLSMMLEYYMLRNELTVNAIYGYGVFTALRIFIYEAGKNLILYRYDNMPIVLRAVKDFLKGVDFFKECDEEQLNAMLIRSAPTLSALHDIPGWSEALRCDDHLPSKKLTAATLLTLGGHLIPAFMLKKEICAFPLSRCGVNECFGKRAVIQYQLDGSTGILTQRSFLKFLKYGFATLSCAIMLLFGFGRMKKQYAARKHELTEMSFWRKHLGI